MEGTAKEVAVQEDALNVIGAQHGGIPGGENNGKRGYQLTFVIAYIRVRFRPRLLFFFFAHLFLGPYRTELFLALPSFS